MGNNLISFLFGGGTKNRELEETSRAWNETQESWRESPLARQEPFDLALRILREAIEKFGRIPVVPIINAAGTAIEALFDAESLTDLEVQWPVIESDVEVAIQFRKMLVRRQRWAADFDRMYGTFERITATALAEFFNALPESCFSDTDTDRGDTFDVPLIDLLDEPTAVIDRLFMLPYDDASFRLDLFYHLRDLCAHNLLLASGFLPDTNIREVERKLIRAPDQKNKTGAELAELYLNGSPFKALLDVPVPFRIPDELRFEHCHIVGGTGHGKTQLMQKMIHADLLASREDGRSVIVIDSQGDLINKLVRLDLFAPDIENSLADRLVVIDPSDVEFPAALNLFDAHLERVRDYSLADQERILNGVIELYEMFFGAFLGAELTQKQGVVFKYLARLMLTIPGATIHTLMRIMEDGKPFKPYMDKLDGSARYFFETEFFHPAFAATKKQVLRRLWGVLSTPAFERMFTQPQNKLDLFEAMNEGKIILVSTAKDLLKRDGSQLLGRFFIAMIAQAALERSALPDYLRRPTFVYVDEAQEYFDDSIETILNQARKYRVGITLAHQTLDQLSPRLRSTILSNTSMKCAGGVSAKDARALAEELRTTPKFIEGMKRRGPRSEFAVWVKHLTGQAIRLSVPLGFLERQSTLADEEYDDLLKLNRARYCGTLADVPILSPQPLPSPARSLPPPIIELETPNVTPPLTVAPDEEKEVTPPIPARVPDKAPLPILEQPAPGERAPGKGGPKHRYLQSLVKELAEGHGFRATLEASLQDGSGQVDVLLERENVTVVVEISVTTPAEWERENLRKCLRAGYGRIALVLAKTKAVQGKYRSAVLETLSPEERERVTLLNPEDIPDFLAGLAPPAPTEDIVKGYRVTVTHASMTREEAAARRAALMRVIGGSLNRR